MTNNPLVEALRECADKLWVLRCNSRDPLDRAAAEKACDMATTALASSAPATGEREQIVAWLRSGNFRHPDWAFAKVFADQIERGDHRTQSGEMEEVRSDGLLPDYTS